MAVFRLAVMTDRFCSWERKGTRESTVLLESRKITWPLDTSEEAFRAMATLASVSYTHLVIPLPYAHQGGMMRPSLLQKGFGPNHVPRGGQLEVILAAFSELNGDAQPLSLIHI